MLCVGLLACLLEVGSLVCTLGQPRTLDPLASAVISGVNHHIQWEEKRIFMILPMLAKRFPKTVELWIRIMTW